jgi:hypothetical protein
MWDGDWRVQKGRGDIADQGEQKSSSHKADELGEQRSTHDDDQ